jgi:hypothetical protein
MHQFAWAAVAASSAASTMMWALVGFDHECWSSAVRAWAVEFAVIQRTSGCETYELDVGDGCA